MIRFDNFTFWYPNVSKPALSDIDLTIEAGETVLVVGPSGCGKSTFLLAMNGVVPNLTGGKVKGRVYVDGKDTRKVEVAELASTVGLILQDPESQLTNLYVYDEIAFGPENLNLPEDVIRERVNRALERSGLEHLEERSVFALSGGQKQRVAIAAAMAMQPDVLLLDNPTSNLDPVGARETYQAIRELCADAADYTLVMADHRPDHIIDKVDRLLVMDQGRVVLDGKPEELYASNGQKLKDQMGLFLPQVVDLSLGIMEKGYPVSKIPLSDEETYEVLREIPLELVSLEKESEGTEEQDTHSAILDLQDVSFQYDSGVKAVRNVSLSISPGEFICLVGQNGSGKTTLAKLMVGLLSKSSGTLLFKGKDISEVPLRDLIGHVGYVFQYPEHQFITNLVREEIAFSPRAMGRPEKEVQQLVEEMLDMFSLRAVASAPPLMLSKGEKRRLSVATMLVTNPEVLILDEPMTGQDQQNIRSLLKILNDMCAAGTTILDITHDMEHVASYAHRVIGMNSGELCYDGGPEELFLDEAVLRELSLEAPPPAVLAARLRKQGVQLPPGANTVASFLEAIRPAQGREIR